MTSQVQDPETCSCVAKQPEVQQVSNGNHDDSFHDDDSDDFDVDPDSYEDGDGLFYDALFN